MPNKTARTRKLAGRSSAALLLQRVEHWHRLHNGPTVMNGDAWAADAGLRMGEFNSSRATLRNRGLITARGWGQMGRGRATALALTDYALAELAAPYLDLGPTELASQPRPVPEKVALQPKPARKKAAVRTAEDDAAMLTQIWGLYLGSRFRWRGVRWVTRTTQEWRIALKLPPQFAVTKKVSEMEEAGWIFVDRWARGYVTVRPTPELVTLMKTHQGVFPVEMLKQGE